MAYIGSPAAPTIATVSDDTITSAKIVDGTIASGDLASGTALANIGTGNITQSYLASGVTGTGPAFYAYGTASVTPSASTSTKVKFNTEGFDTASCYDNATNYRFTPNVAGYYQINVGINMTSGVNRLMAMIYKNGSEYTVTDINANTVKLVTTGLVYLNGSTDYVEGYTWNSNGGVAVYSNNNTFFSGCLVRAA